MAHELLQDFAAEVRARTVSEVRLDATSRKLYSTDASIYQIEPLGVALPRHEDDLVAIVQLAAERKIPVLPRGSGTSLAGQTIGPAVIIDFSRYLSQVLEIDAGQRTAWVQPGLVLNSFNKALKPHGLMFGPDPASSDRATLGGMMGNNSTGAHSISYGMTSDNILAADVLLADGSGARLESVAMQEALSRAEGDTLEAGLYRRALTIREQYAETIQARWPRTWRRASGYSLNYLLPWSPSQPPMWARAGAGEQYPPVAKRPASTLAPAIVGSEGTLVILKRIQTRLVPKPKLTMLGVLSYPSIAEACDAAPGLLKLQPSAIELIPRAMINLARSVPAYAQRLGFVKGDPAAILIIEFAGETAAEVEAGLAQLGPGAVLARSQAEQDEVWAVRKVGLGLLMSRPGDAKPLPFIEDVAVPVEKLGQFVRAFERILAEAGTGGDFYAHASAGCLHVRPLLNLKTLRGAEQMRAITQAVMAEAKKVGGAMSGEHGDGLSHGEWLEETFGPEINIAFRELKQAADPQHLLNPGKILQPQRMDTNLRYGVEYKADPWLPILDFSSQGGLGGAIEMCNGAGVCRKDGGVMCPSFQATREEEHSTRGRGNLLRAMISTGAPGPQAQHAAHAALDLCLECKGCKAECPSGVDMAKIKYDFLNDYYRTHRRPLRDYLFGYIGVLGQLGRAVAPLSNLMLQSGLGKQLGEKLFGLSAKRGLPKFKGGRKLPAVAPAQADVFFLRDPFIELFYPDIAEAALRVLAATGLKAAVLPFSGAGRTLISKGLLPQAQQHARRLVQTLEAWDPERRTPVVGIEPSEIYTFKDEYLDLLPGEAGVPALAKRTFMLDEFLLRPGPQGQSYLDALRAAVSQQGSRSVLVHGHCYQKAQPPADDGAPSGAAATAALLAALGFEVEMVNSGCCGMAGSFGYEAEHYDVSMQIGELALFPAVRQAPAAQHVVASGVSCRAQIASGTGREVLHPVELIAGLIQPQMNTDTRL